MSPATTLAGADQTVTLEAFDSPRDSYSHTVGPEWPGAKARFRWSKEGGVKPGALAVEYDFRKGGNYVGWMYAGFLPPLPKSIRIACRTNVATVLTFRMGDSTGQTHQQQRQVPAGKNWQTVTFPVAADVPGYSHWGGKADGKIHLPLKRLMVGFEKPAPGAVGVLLIDDVQVVSGASRAAIRHAWEEAYWSKTVLRFQTEVPGNLFYPSDRVGARLSAVRPIVPTELKVTVKAFDAWGNCTSEAAPVALNANNNYSTTFTALPKSLGYYGVSMLVTGGGRSRTEATRYAVIPPNPALGRRERESPFGVNTHFNQWWPAEVGRIAKRAGVAWVRDGEANHLCYMPCFTHFRASIAARMAKAIAAGKSPGSTWDFSKEVEFHRKFAAKYGHYVDYYDLMNEPHASWGAVLGGGWSGGAWQKAFAQYGREVTAAIHQADPGSTVLWEDVDQLLWYRQFHAIGAADTIDAISPHTYSLHRDRSLPEDHPVLRQMTEFRAFTRKHKLSWPVWAGEVGFSSFALNEKTPTGFYAPHTEVEQAAMLVRMYVLQLSAGIDKIFWYDFLNDGWDANNPEHNFGIIRRDLLPKPGVVAYANLAHRLRGTRWLGRYVIGGGADAVAYAAKESGKITVIAWVRKGTKDEVIAVPSRVKELTLTDIFGQSRVLPVTGDRSVVPLTTSPTLVDGLQEKDVLPLLQSP